MIRTIHIESIGIHNFSQVREAVILSNDLLDNIQFYRSIAHHPYFDLADITPGSIADLMLLTGINMHIELYYALCPLKNYDGYDDTDDPTAIHINVWKLDRSPASICNTIIHSCVHAVNAYHSKYHFGHGDLPLQARENTAPYWIGALAQQMVSKEDTIILPFEHDDLEPKVKHMRERYLLAH
jgi:hypothetical protein